MNDKNRAYLSAIESARNPFAELSRTQSAIERSIRPFTELSRTQFAIEKAMRPFAELSRTQSTIERSIRPFTELSRTQFAIEKAIRPTLDWQKQVNFLSKTQVSLGFPNTIRSELSANPFRISPPTQRRTPLFDSPPTASTGEVYEEISPEIIPAPSPELVPITNQEKVFIVHGHDHAARDTVEDFVDNWDLIPIVLDKEPNKGRTIIEKFEDLADETSFAIVLLTPDDVGGPASVQQTGDLQRRARQNVILELGYFLKGLGRPKVCILYKEGVELPSDIHGLLYVPMDDAGEWRQTVIREIESAGLLIDGNKI